MYLYIYYCKIPEIMATSAGISMILFFLAVMLVVGLILIGVLIMLMKMNVRIIV